MKNYKLKNNKDIIIRKANVEDASKMIEYLNKIAGESDFLTFGEGEINITIEREKVIIEDTLKADNKLFIIAETEGIIVGNLNFSGGARQRIRHVGEFGVSVLKGYWGMGIGKELIQYLICWAKESHIISKINLRTREDNKNAIKLYHELGFKTEGILTRDFYVKGQYYSSITMGLKID